MKKVVFILALVFAYAAGWAQKVEVKEADNALSVVVYERELDDVMKEWRSLMKKNDAKVESEKNRMIAQSAIIKSMSGATYDVTATFTEIKKGEVRMDVVFDPVITSTSGAPPKEQYISQAKKLLKGFAVEQTKGGIEALLKLEKKNLTKLNDQKEDLAKRKEKLEREIEEAKETIKKDEEEIKQNIESQKTKTAEIETQEKAVEAVQKKLTSIE